MLSKNQAEGVIEKVGLNNAAILFLLLGGKKKKKKIGWRRTFDELWGIDGVSKRKAHAGILI